MIQPTCPPVNDHLMELLVMMDRQARVSQGITAVLPRIRYGRRTAR